MAVSFILAFLITLASVLLFVAIVYADGMSDSPSTRMNPWPVLFAGCFIAALLIGSHYLKMNW